MPVGPAHDMLCGCPVSGRPGVGQHDNRSLQSLGLVHVHDLHRVRASRLQRRFGVLPRESRFEGLHGSDQRRISSQRLCLHGVERVHQRSGAERAEGTASGVGKKAEPIDEPADQHVRRLALALDPPLVQRREGASSVGIGLVRQPREVESATPLGVGHELLVIEAEEEPDQHRDHTHTIAWIDQCPE